VTRPITDLCLTRRVRMLLVGAGIQTIDALCERPASSLLNLPRFGLAALDEVRAELAALGLALAGEHVEVFAGAPPPHDLTPSEVALAKMLAAWDEWRPSVADPEDDAMRMLDDIGDIFDRFGMTRSPRLADDARDLLDRARKAGVL
jgi:hypothetical protein